MREIVNLADNMEIAADIGCDHGFIAVALIEEKRAKEVIACDISEKSLQKTKDLVLKKGLGARIKTHVADGLDALYRYDTLGGIIIAGMGGLLIRDILCKDIAVAEKAKKLVLSPQGNEYELRLFLFENGFSISDERIVQDEGKFYQVIEAQPGRDIGWREIYLRYGYYPALRKEPIQKEFLQLKLKELDIVIQNAGLGKNTENYIKEKKALKEQILEVLECL